MRKPLADLAGDRQLEQIERRLFLRNGLSLGALALLTGCDITNKEPIYQTLLAMSRWNDRVQAWLFNPHRLAPTFSESEISQPRFNGFYEPDKAPRVDPATYRLELSGLIDDKRPWTVDQLYALPQQSQITRHVCIEGWSFIGKWTGTPLRSFLERVGADVTAKYVGFKCADGYYGSLDMPSALHPQTLVSVKFDDEILPTQFGFPMRLRVPTKLGFKSPKHVVAMFVTNTYPSGYWEDRGYNWFSGS